MSSSLHLSLTESLVSSALEGKQVCFGSVDFFASGDDSFAGGVSSLAGGLSLELEFLELLD